MSTGRRSRGIVLRGRARGLRDGRLLGRPVRSAEVDRGDQEKAGRAHPAAARGQALRELRLQREQHALAVPAREPESRQRRRVCGRAVRRNREFLEGFSLDTLKMVGTFKVGNNFYGLVQSKDGLVHKVQPGNYMGQNDGKVTEITGSKISLVEIIPDGLGGYIERPASLALARLRPQGEQSMIRFKIRTAMIGAMALVALSAIHLQGPGAGRRPAQARVDRRADAVGPAGPAQAASERSGSRAAAVHHRQAGAHRVRLAEHHAGAALAPHRRALGRCRYGARGRGQRPHAPGRQRRSARCPTRPRSTATPSS